jgi:hypothetical protein
MLYLLLPDDTSDSESAAALSTTSVIDLTWNEFPTQTEKLPIKHP